MTKEEIKFWCDKYNKEEDLKFPNLEKVLGIKIRRQKFLQAHDLIKVLRWKYQGALRGRGEHFVRLLEQKEKQMVKNFSEMAFKQQDEYIIMDYLDSIPTVGSAVFSVILSFYDPKNYGVFDIHAWREFFGKEPKNLFTKINYIKFLSHLRSIAKETNIPCRDIEKAFFKKNKDESARKNKKIKI